ncbi:MAG TPA: cupredoxin domain-containing protein [Gaiellaceae bacterium]|nr:cupredoxin domain-containing protein [Gaiellaceae bacterium]
MLIALTTGNKVGLAVTAAVFIAFALASSFLFPRFRPNYPGGGLPAFVVVCFVFFFGMLAAVEHFGAESKAETAQIESEAGTTTTQPTTTHQQTTTAPAHTTTQAQTTTQEQAATVQVTETEFRIALAGYNARARKFTFDVKNAGQIAHDLAIKGGPKTSLIQPGGTATLNVTLKPGRYHLYCTVPGHEQAGMKVDIIVK